MKTFHLNIVFEGEDNLIYSYESLYHLRSQWRKDARDFLAAHGANGEDDCDWYPYFTQEGEDGEVRDLPYSKALGGTA